MAWSVPIHQNGRSGAIRHAEGALRAHEFLYEFCGGTAVAAKGS